MSQRSGAQRDLARRLLLREQRGDGPDEPAAAAGRVHTKLQLCLAPLVGAAGVRALFARSLAQTTPEFPFLAAVALEPPEAALESLTAALQGTHPAAVLNGAAALFGAFLTLLATFVGERLTAQVLSVAWPDDGETFAKEPVK